MKSVCIFAGSNLGHKASYKSAATKLGRELVKNNFSMVYGGGGVGLMNEIANEVLDGGGKVTGVITERLKKAEAGHKNFKLGSKEFWDLSKDINSDDDDEMYDPNTSRKTRSGPKINVKKSKW